MDDYHDTANWSAVVKNKQLLYYIYNGNPPNGKPKFISSNEWPTFVGLGGGSRRRTVHRKRKSHRNSKRVRHTRRKQTRRHRHRR
jgi:hypothetical protein